MAKRGRTTADALYAEAMGEAALERQQAEAERSRACTCKPELRDYGRTKLHRPGCPRARRT